MISNLAEERALRSNLPTGFTMSKADGIDVEIDTCNVTATDSTGAVLFGTRLHIINGRGTRPELYDYGHDERCSSAGPSPLNLLVLGPVAHRLSRCTDISMLTTSHRPHRRLRGHSPTERLEFIATPTALIGTNTINLSVSLANSVETLGALGDTLTNAEREIDDEEVRAAQVHPIPPMVVVSGGVVVPQGSDSSLTSTLTESNRVAGVSFENVALGDGSGDTTIEITLSDEAGNQTALTTFTVTVDVDAPVLVSLGLPKSSVVLFRVPQHSLHLKMIRHRRVWVAWQVFSNVSQSIRPVPMVVKRHTDI